MRKMMMGLAFVAVATFGGGAWAYTCPLLASQLKAQLPKVKDQQKKAEAEKLLKECEALHNAGKHNESVDKCVEAGKVAGITLTMSEAAQKTYDQLHKR